MCAELTFGVPRHLYCPAPWPLWWVGEGCPVAVQGRSKHCGIEPFGDDPRAPPRPFPLRPLHPQNAEPGRAAQDVSRARPQPLGLFPAAHVSGSRLRLPHPEMPLRLRGSASSCSLLARAIPGRGPRAWAAVARGRVAGVRGRSRTPAWTRATSAPQQTRQVRAWLIPEARVPKGYPGPRHLGLAFQACSFDGEQSPVVWCHWEVFPRQGQVPAAPG